MSPKPFDTATKQLIERYPESWLQLSGVAAGGEVQVIDADLATVIAEADKVLRVDAPEPLIVHLEMQSSYSAGLSGRLLKYNVLLQDRHEAPVRSVVVLLRREADGPDMSGNLRRVLPGGEWYLDFRYNVIRLWQVPAEQLLAGGLGNIAAVATREDGCRRTARRDPPHGRATASGSGTARGSHLVDGDVFAPRSTILKRVRVRAS